MSDTLITIIGIFLAAILMFVFPLMTVTNTQDDISQVAVQSLVSEFVNNAATKGKVTQNDYNTLISKLYATGNTLKAIKQAIEKKIPYGVYHTTNEGFTTWYDFTKTIFEKANISCKVNPVTTEEYIKKGDVLKIIYDNIKLVIV